MMIREFHSRFSSAEESSWLFAVLRRLSLLDEVTSMSVADKAWVEWPSYQGSRTGPGAAAARA
ncbi:MAG: hypothetical protein WAM82_16845 [Thermoanaerobaculia bacterium]